MRNHEIAVGWIHLVLSAVLIGGVVFLWVASAQLGKLFKGSFIPGLVAMFGKPLAVALILIALIDFIGAIGMLRGLPWSRNLLVIISVTELPIFPFGTLVGLYTLWALLAR